MILTIKGADFSGSGLVTNTSVSISYNGNVSGTPGFIEKNKALTSKITIKTGYTYNSISSVTVGGSAITGYTATDNGNGTVTLTIPANLITGKIVVNVKTTAISGGETGGDSEGDSEQPGTGGGSGETPSVPTDNLMTLGTKLTGKKLSATNSQPITDEKYVVYENIPVLATSVYKFTNVLRSWWKKEDESDISNFNPQNSMVVSPKNTSYLSITVNPTKNSSVELIYDGSSDTKPSGQNIITNGTFNNNKSLSSNAYSLTDNEGFYVYDKIPVTPGEIYKISKPLRVWWLDSSNKEILTENLNTVGGVCIVPDNAAYLSVTINSESIPQSDAYMIRVI